MEPNNTMHTPCILSTIIPNKNYNLVKDYAMIKVEFLGPIAKAPLEMEATTLAEVSAKLKEDSTLVQWLDKCAVALNDTMVNDLSTTLKDGDKVSILPPVCGG
jgi:molybdopterin synthase sulfur carrier subunit